MSNDLNEEIGNGDEPVEPIVKTITDDATSSVSYVCRTYDHNASTSEPKWQIKRISLVGKRKIEEFANFGAYNQICDNRQNLFPPIEFATIKSILTDGVDEYVNFGNDTSLQITDELSVFTWVKALPQDLGTLQSKWDASTNNNGWALMTGPASSNDDDKLRVVLSRDGDSIRKDWYSSITVFDNNWHLVGFTFSAGTLKIYIDGVWDQNPTMAVEQQMALIFNSQSPNRLGALKNLTGALSNFFSGYQTNIAIWNTNVLTDSEILSVYNNGVPVDYDRKIGDYDSDSDLVSFWRPDNSTFDVLEDTETNTNDGTMVNMEAGDLVEEAP